jgi:hypothetical protein
MIMARKSKRQRLEEQRIRQAAVRKEAREKKKPNRDHMARLLLWLMIRQAHDKARRQRSTEPLDKLCTLLVNGLVEQGYDVRESEALFDMLERKYLTQEMPGRIKRHPQSGE